MREKDILWDHAAEFNNQIIEPDVEAYLEKEPYVYCIGDYYTKLEYNEEVWQQAESPYVFSEEDQKIFFMDRAADRGSLPGKKVQKMVSLSQDF